MKTLLPLILFLLSISFLSAQDLSLPKGSSTIYLHTGKIIKPVTLWRIDSVKVEYVLKGNLADSKTLDVSKIETPEFLIEFDQEHHISKRGYDIIILASKDTLKGIIQRIDDGVISYQPVGGDKIKHVMKFEVESYSQWKEKNGSRIDIVSDQNPASTFYHESVKDTLAQENLVKEEENEHGMPKVEVEEVLDLKASNKYYIQSYERGVRDVKRNDKSTGWGGGGFLLGMTIGSPILSLAASTSHVSQDSIPAGVDEKLYRAGYENEIVKKRTRKAAAGAIAGKILILIFLITSL